MTQQTQRSRAFPPTLCQRVARIFLTAPFSYEAVALHWGQCGHAAALRKTRNQFFPSPFVFCPALGRFVHTYWLLFSYDFVVSVEAWDLCCSLKHVVRRCFPKKGCILFRQEVSLWRV